LREQEWPEAIRSHLKFVALDGTPILFSNTPRLNIEKVLTMEHTCVVFAPTGGVNTPALFHKTSNLSSRAKNSSTDALIPFKSAKSKCK
jgi:hypothetical protein